LVEDLKLFTLDIFILADKNLQTLNYLHINILCSSVNAWREEKIDPISQIATFDFDFDHNNRFLLLIQLSGLKLNFITFSAGAYPFIITSIYSRYSKNCIS
jgi:hypothetical protein